MSRNWPHVCEEHLTKCQKCGDTVCPICLANAEKEVNP